MGEEKKRWIPAQSVSALTSPTAPSPQNVPSSPESKPLAPTRSEMDVDADAVIPTAVVMYNDDVTAQDVVEDILVGVFGHPPNVAAELTMEVHNHGEATIAVRPSWEAERLVTEAIHRARIEGMPLRFDLRDADAGEEEADR